MDLSFIENLEKSNAVLAKYDDIAGEIKSNAAKEFNILAGEQLKVQIQKVNEEGRLLSIGIIGRVKAGKSSLLNALFFEGKSVLPKAATPMTAALTVMTYGEEPKAIIEYFTKSDVDILKKEYDEWTNLYKIKYEENKTIAEQRAKERNEELDLEKLERKVKRELKELSCYYGYEQYSKMLESGLFDSVYNSNFTTTKEIPSDSVDSLMKELNNYVGAEGQYTPFTKSVQLFLNNQSLKDIQIVDTPGVNDPIKSREKRTQDFLGECDVVFMVVPSGQFISEVDLNLMALSAGNKGIQKIYIVGSQCDTQLYGNEKDDAGGILPNVIKNINKHLGEYAQETFAQLKKNNPEVGEAYDAIINEGEKYVIFTSSLCHSIMLHYEDKSVWDEDMIYNWDLLKETYPDYFTEGETGKANLALLSGITKLEEAIKTVRNEKDKIIAEKQAVFVNKQKEVVEQYIKLISADLKNYKADIESKDVESIEKEKKELENIKKSASYSVNDAFQESVITFKIDLRKKMKDQSKGLVSEITDDVNSAETTEIKVETKYKNESVEKKGVFAWFARKLGWGGYETRTIPYNEEKEIRTLRTTAITSSLNRLAFEIADTLNDTADLEILNWKQSVQSSVIHTIREKIEDVDLISISSFESALRTVFNNLDLPEFNLSSVKYQSNYSSIIKDKDIDEFRNEFENYISNLSNEYTQQINNFIRAFESCVKGINIADNIFDELNAKLEKLEKDLDNKQLILSRLEECLSELEQ